MKLPKNKKRANISIMAVVFCVAFLAFCAFGIDMAYVMLNRTKLQRATETTALASIAEYKNTNEDKSDIYFNLFKSKIDTIKNAKLEEIEYKEDQDGTKKVRIKTSVYIPTFFLRFTGVGRINIKANSYAKAEEVIINDKKSADIIELNELVTNKNGYDLKIETTNISNGYFIFAGIKNNDNVYKWADIGCKSDSATTITQKGLNNYSLVNSNSTLIDLEKTCEPQINVNAFTHLKFFTNTQIQGDYTFKVTILNNVKLITKNDF